MATPTCSANGSTVPPGTRPGVSEGIDPGDLGDDVVKTNRIGGQRLRVTTIRAPEPR